MQLSHTMEEIVFEILFYIFRKIGMLTRYIFFLLIGRKKTLAYIDREQEEIVNFTQRGINVVVGIGVVIAVIWAIVTLV